MDLEGYEGVEHSARENAAQQQRIAGINESQRVGALSVFSQEEHDKAMLALQSGMSRRYPRLVLTGALSLRSRMLHLQGAPNRLLIFDQSIVTSGLRA